MIENRIIANNGSSIVLYTTEDGNTQLEVKLDKDTVWLTQSQMAELFGRDRTVVGRHIRNIFKEGELDESLVCAKNATPKKYGRKEGYNQMQNIDYYNLDMIISVGYRVNYTASKMMGNADVRSTQIYAKIVDRKKIEAVNMVDKMFEKIESGQE